MNAPLRFRRPAVLAIASVLALGAASTARAQRFQGAVALGSGLFYDPTPPGTNVALSDRFAMLLDGSVWIGSRPGLGIHEVGSFSGSQAVSESTGEARTEDVTTMGTIFMLGYAPSRGRNEVWYRIGAGVGPVWVRDRITGESSLRSDGWGRMGRAEIDLNYQYQKSQSAFLRFAWTLAQTKDLLVPGTKSTWTSSWDRVEVLLGLGFNS